MNSKPSSRCHPSSSAYAIYNNRLNKDGVRCLPNGSGNASSVNENDNGEQQRTRLAVAKCVETKLKSTVWAGAGFYCETYVSFDDRHS